MRSPLDKARNAESSGADFMLVSMSYQYILIVGRPSLAVFSIRTIPREKKAGKRVLVSRHLLAVFSGSGLCLYQFLAAMYRTQG